MSNWKDIYNPNKSVRSNRCFYITKNITAIFDSIPVNHSENSKITFISIYWFILLTSSNLKVTGCLDIDMFIAIRVGKSLKRIFKSTHLFEIISQIHR